VTGILTRLSSAFVAPDAHEVRHAEARSAPAVAAARAVAVLARPEDARVLGGAVALVAAAGRAAVLAVWTGGEERGGVPRAPATPAARRLAGTLGQRGHTVHATGRLAVVALGGGAAEAAAEAARATAAAGDATVVVVLAGPRDDRVDALLRAQDQVLVATGGNRIVTGLAVTSLAAADVPATPLDLEVPAVARALAATGTAVTGAVRRSVEAALR
jgi:hypothetical protein